mgnify:CR=1 FL=1
MNISKKDYEEYLKYKNRLDLEKSLQHTYNLEDDIDFPIRNSVAILALAGCSPLFSCCGFDYHGQPIHKAHQYGEPYIMLKGDNETREVIGRIYLRLPSGWRVTSRSGLVYIELTSLNNPHWDDPSVIHYSENLVIAINALESALFSLLKDNLLEEVILEDTNKNHNKNLKYWQYPPKNPWVITIDSLTV